MLSYVNPHGSKLTYIFFQILVPTAPPRNLTATPGMANATLMWITPVQPNGNVIYMYEVIDSYGMSVTSGMTMELSVTVTDLDVFTNYTFNVTASTSGGSTDPATGMFTTFQGSMIYSYKFLALNVLDLCISILLKWICQCVIIALNNGLVLWNDDVANVNKCYVNYLLSTSVATLATGYCMTR